MQTIIKLIPCMNDLLREALWQIKVPRTSSKPSCCYLKRNSVASWHRQTQKNLATQALKQDRPFLAQRQASWERQPSYIYVDDRGTGRREKSFCSEYKKRWSPVAFGNHKGTSKAEGGEGLLFWFWEQGRFQSPKFSVENFRPHYLA